MDFLLSKYAYDGGRKDDIRYQTSFANHTEILVEDSTPIRNILASLQQNYYKDQLTFYLADKVIKYCGQHHVVTAIGVLKAK